MFNQTTNERLEAEVSEIETPHIFTKDTNDSSRYFYFEETKKTSDISEIFVHPFFDCLKTLPRIAQVVCSLDYNSRSCEIKCFDSIEQNFCVCDNTACSWKNSFNEKCLIKEWRKSKEKKKRDQNQREEKRLNKILKKGKN